MFEIKPKKTIDTPLRYPKIIPQFAQGASNMVLLGEVKTNGSRGNMVMLKPPINMGDTITLTMMLLFEVKINQF